MIQWEFEHHETRWYSSGKGSPRWEITVNEAGQFVVQDNRNVNTHNVGTCPSLLAAKALCERVAMIGSEHVHS